MVEFARFAEEARRHCPGAVAYLRSAAESTLVSAFDPGSRVLVRSSTTLPIDQAQNALLGAGLQVGQGHWVAGEGHEDDALSRPLWVAAVSYRSHEDRPGLWVDASFEERSAGDVLNHLHEEFRREGSLSDVPIEDFIRLADPNVVLLSPDDLRHFAQERERPVE